MYHIAYISGSRAEYGIVKRLLSKLSGDNLVELSIIVTAMHLEEKYGLTYRTILSDGFSISNYIPIKMENDNNQNIISSMSDCLDKFGVFFQNNSFDAIILLGDRYEVFAIACAAAIHNIPIIHLHGGEKTLGNYDEFIRHSITKMSKLHLVSTESYRKRVIQLGECPDTVVNIGSLGAENSLSLELLDYNTVLNKIKITRPYFVVVFHPETITNNDLDSQIKELISALERLYLSYDFVLIGSNSDTNAYRITKAMFKFSQKYSLPFFVSVTPEEYLSFLRFSLGIIGNSSSGIIEAPSLGIPTINLGDRQKGREKGKTVIDCPINAKLILHAVRKSQSGKFKVKLKNTNNPYFSENTLDKAYTNILYFLKSINKNTPKDFWDIYI